MARHWKERYTQANAKAVGIHDFENVSVVGDSNAEWIYYVDVCGFMFAFFSLEMLKEYLEFYSKNILPTSRFGAAAGIGDGQTKFDRLPLKLRKKGKRQKVVKALERALNDFSR